MNMDLDQKFQQRWEYRRKDHEVDSSSDDSKSSSVDELVQKKHKLVSNLSVPQMDAAIDTLRSEQNSQVDGTKGVHFQIAEVTKENLVSGKKKNAVDNKFKRNCGRKRKRKVHHPTQDQEPELLGDLKIFTESLLEDLKAAREKMFVQMRRQMTKLAAAKPVLRQRRSNCLVKSDGVADQTGMQSSKKTGSSSGGLKKGHTKDNVRFDTRKCSKANEVRTNHEKAIESNRMDKGETISLPVKKPIHLPKDSNQIGSSPHLTLPTVLPKPQTESLTTDSSLCDLQCGFPVNNANNLERENSLVDANNQYSYLLGIQPDEQFGSFADITSKSMGFLDQQSIQTSSVVSATPAPFHGWSNNDFNITSKRVLQNPAEENNAIDLRMNGGAIGFPERSHALSECFVTNTISSNKDYNTNGGLVSLRSRDTKRDHV